MSDARRGALAKLLSAYPDDPGVLISLLLHLVALQPGEAIYLAARQLHAYLDGIAVEVMAASDNVLRAGFTQKHVDVAEVLRIVDFSQLDTPLIEPERLAPGLVAWSPGVPEFTPVSYTHLDVYKRQGLPVWLAFPWLSAPRRTGPALERLQHQLWAE